MYKNRVEIYLLSQSKFYSIYHRKLSTTALQKNMVISMAIILFFFIANILEKIPSYYFIPNSDFILVLITKIASKKENFVACFSIDYSERF